MGHADASRLRPTTAEAFGAFGAAAAATLPHLLPAALVDPGSAPGTSAPPLLLLRMCCSASQLARFFVPCPPMPVLAALPATLGVASNTMGSTIRTSGATPPSLATSLLFFSCCATRAQRALAPASWSFSLLDLSSLIRWGTAPACAIAAWLLAWPRARLASVTAASWRCLTREAMPPACETSFTRGAMPPACAMAVRYTLV